MIHDLKILPHFFEPIKKGIKTWEIRNEEDRKFEVGDYLILNEYLPEKGYTGEKIKVRVVYILRESETLYLPKNMVCMSIEIVEV